MQQVRNIRYRAIADGLRRQIASAGLVPGAVLPSESELAAAHDVSRVTVRKALDVLREEGLVDSRQGFGWFVAGDRVRQTLGALATIEGQLADEGRSSVRQVVSFGFREPPPRVGALLGSDDVLEVVRVNLADGHPFAVVTVWCPASLGASLSRDDVEASTFYELLPVQFVGAVQTIGASVADEVDAERLGVPVGSPLLVCERDSRDASGEVKLVSEHRFPAHVTEFVVDLPLVESDVPAGLRLVDDQDTKGAS